MATELGAFSKRLRELRELAAEGAKEAAPLVAEALRKTASAGTTPDGQPWKPTKGGQRALSNAADAIAARAIGNVIEIILSGHYVFHHYGTKRLPQRAVIPENGGSIPAVVTDACRRGAVAAFRRIMGGG